MDASLQDHLSAMCRGIATGNGWYQLVDGFCAQLQHETDDEGAPPVVATQAKEKFGTLGFRAHDFSERQSAMVELAVELSGRNCDACGAPGSAVQIRRLKATRCAMHADHANYL